MWLSQPRQAQTRGRAIDHQAASSSGARWWRQERSARNQAVALATGLVREDGRARLSDELHPDVVGEILLAKMERQDPVARATAWLRAERSWRHHLAPLLEAA